MSITPWQMHLICTNGAKQHHLYVRIVTKIKHFVICETSFGEKRYNYRHDSIPLNLERMLESIKSIIHRHSRV